MSISGHTEHGGIGPLTMLLGYDSAAWCPALPPSAHTGSACVCVSACDNVGEVVLQRLCSQVGKHRAAAASPWVIVDHVYYGNAGLDKRKGEGFS